MIRIAREILGEETGNTRSIRWLWIKESESRAIGSHVFFFAEHSDLWSGKADRVF
jgi:hypothetical protein